MNANPRLQVFVKADITHTHISTHFKHQFSLLKFVREIISKHAKHWRTKNEIQDIPKPGSKQYNKENCEQNKAISECQ